MESVDIKLELGKCLWTFDSTYFSSSFVHLDPWGHCYKSYRVGLVKLKSKLKQEQDKFYENCLKGNFVFLDMGCYECQ